MPSKKELNEKRAANARRGKAEKRKAAEFARSDTENDSARVSPRTVKLLPILQSLAERGLLPHLDLAISAFFAGAADGWRHFSQEFLPGGSIASATTEQRASIVVPATNDTCESLVGGYCVEKRGAPAMCTPFFNAKTMFRRNHTSPYLKGLAPGHRGHIRREHRRRDALGLPKLERKRQLAFERKRVAEGRAAEARREEKRRKLQRDLDLAAATRFLSLGAMLESEGRKRLTGAIISSNLSWHKHRGRADVQARYKATSPKPTLVRAKRALLYAILEHLCQPIVEGAAVIGYDWQAVVEEVSGEQVEAIQPADLWE